MMKKDLELPKSKVSFDSPAAHTPDQVTEYTLSTQPVSNILQSMHQLGCKAQQEYERLIADFRPREREQSSAGTNGILTKRANMEETDARSESEQLRIEPLGMEQSCRV